MAVAVEEEEEEEKDEEDISLPVWIDVKIRAARRLI